MTTNPSIIWFTAHKCASVYARSILQNLAQDQGMIYEDVYSHKRQVKPGDHRRKLQVNTIKQLNLELLYILKRYGWLRDGLQEADELFKLNLERAIHKLDNFQLLLEQAKQQITSD